MDEQNLADLAQRLVTDEENGFQRFRQLFFEALERRRLADCQALLEVLCATSSPGLQRDCHYHQAILLSEQQQFDQAEIVLRRLLADDLSADQRARTLLELGLQLEFQGQWPESERFYLEALSAYEANQDQLGKAKAYNNLGILIRFRVEQGESPPERLPEALSCHQTALALAQAADDKWRMAKNWHGIGMAYGLMKQYPLALAAFQNDLSLCQALDDAYDRAITLTDLAALVYQPQGQWAEAAAALSEAITILRQFDDDLHLAEALTRRGNLLVAQEHPKEALADYDDALARAESIRARLTAPAAQAGYRATAEFIYTAPISLHLQRGDAARAFTTAERARSRVLAELLAGQNAQPQAEIPGHLLEQRTAMHQMLDQAYAAETPPANLPNLEEALANLDRQIELLDPTYASLEMVASLTAEEVSERLAPEAALLTYVGDADDRLWVVVVTAGGLRATPIKSVSLSWLRNYLSDHLDGVRRGSLVPEPQTGRLSPPQLFPALHRALVAPVWDELQAVQTVYVVPFGPLHYLPLGALTPDLASPPPMLAAGRRVVYAPSATILMNYCHTRPSSTQRGLLAVAPQDARLQFTHGAADTLARQAHGLALTGLAATRQALLEEAGHYQVLCFLGHAWFDQRHPMSSRLQLADGSLHASEILRELRLQADLVILSACETGRSHVLRGDEILGLSRAMLYAGTPSLLVTLWPVHEIPTRLLVENFVQHLSLARPSDVRFDPALALAATQRWLRALSFAEAKEHLAGWGELSASAVEAQLTALWYMTHPAEPPQAESRLFSHPFFWSPYVLIGDRLSSARQLHDHTHRH